ncbi:hypothetical protein AMATHDRAFT_137566 [Amanita thiersii Skay4041]|uniref:Carboxymuconolactone decarboxylase-like domain-containing protein n=1 Tax=Amanita thiersii Skay4041 TaxID=703135 RepID=A0A2A9NW25_9AGAR|nr:hypothetical protein AMATHDRAFT_137566 [Amanita thiersii Skay4041]
MSILATPAFLRFLQSIFPAQYPSNPWFIITAVAFSASNRPEEVPRVFNYAIQQIESEQERLKVAKKVREALFKAGLTSGYSRTINSLRALHEVMPPELKETKLLRDVDAPLAQYQSLGKQTFQALYGETAQPVQSLLDTIYPDLGWFSETIGYGFTYGVTDVLSLKETSYVLVTSLIEMDTAQQLVWHLKNLRRIGATVEEIRAVRQIAIEVGKVAGVKWQGSIPEVEAEE